MNLETEIPVFSWASSDTDRDVYPPRGGRKSCFKLVFKNRIFFKLNRGIIRYYSRVESSRVTGSDLYLPLKDKEEFFCRLQKNGRVFLPRVVVWKNIELKPHEILDVHVYSTVSHEHAYFSARLTRRFCFTIPRLLFTEKLEAQPGDILEIALKNID